MPVPAVIVLNCKSTPDFCLNTSAPVPTFDAVLASPKDKLSILS